MENDYTMNKLAFEKGKLLLNKEAAHVRTRISLLDLAKLFSVSHQSKFYFIFCSAELLDLLTFTSFVSINTNIMPQTYTLALEEENPYYSKRCRGLAVKRVYKYISLQTIAIEVRSIWIFIHIFHYRRKYYQSASL